MFIAVETENVPIDRVLETLEQRLSVDSSDVKTRLNLARLHSMAWSSRRTPRPPSNAASDPGSRWEIRTGVRVQVSGRAGSAFS